MRKFDFAFEVLKVVFFSLIILAFVRCSSEKKIARKDDAALQRVSAKRSLLDQLRGQMDSLYPSNCDTSKPGVPIFLPGKVIQTPVYFPLNVYHTRTIDTTIHNHRIRLDSLGNLSFVFNDKTDTIQLPGITITDNKKIDIARNAEFAAKISLAKQLGITEQLRIDLKGEKKTSMWSMVINAVQFAISILLVYLLFKKKTTIL